MTSSEMALIAEDWQYHLKAKHLSPATIRSYREAVRLLDQALVAEGITTLVGIDQRAVEKFLIGMQDRVSTGTVLTRFRSLRVFFNWLIDEGEIERSPMAKMKEPKGEQRVPDVPADDDVRRLFASLNKKTFEDRRDLALLRFMFDTGCRIGEVLGLKVADLDFEDQVALLHGKGSKERIVRFGDRTLGALVAYRRERNRHPHASLDAFFVSQRGPFTYNGAYRVIKDRAAAVGLRLHPHQTRHHFAHNWLRKGGAEGDLASIGGWDSPVVMRRYGRSAASERAREQHKKLAPGDSL